jgi:deoxyribodipyrimidine photo-lyase
MSKGISICVFRNDLRVQDNPVLTAALRSGRTLLPLYIWDPRQYNLTPLNSIIGSKFSSAQTWYFKFDRCLAPRMRLNLRLKTLICRFRVESVIDLQKNLKRHGSDLLIRYGTPEEVLPALSKYLSSKGFQPVEVYMHREVVLYEIKANLAGGL